jgi:hypothetical protein
MCDDTSIGLLRGKTRGNSRRAWWHPWLPIMGRSGCAPAVWAPSSATWATVSMIRQFDGTFDTAGGVVGLDRRTPEHGATLRDAVVEHDHVRTVEVTRS